MRLVKKINLLCIVCLTVSFCIAQSKDGRIESKYRAINWGIENGLSQAETWCMLKDINGFLWIGTRFGLNRFDGSVFKNYFAGKNRNDEIIGNFIISLIEDSLRNIWLGTDKGLSRYDIKADTFTHFLPAPDSANSNTESVPFWATRDEVYCFEKDSWIIVYNIHSFKKKKLVKLPQLYVFAPRSVFDASTNTIWMLLGGKNGLL